MPIVFFCFFLFFFRFIPVFTVYSRVLSCSISLLLGGCFPFLLFSCSVEHRVDRPETHGGRMT